MQCVRSTVKLIAKAHLMQGCDSGRPCDWQVDVQMSTAEPATSLTIDEKGIAWKSDVSKKFGDQHVPNFNVNPATRGGGTVTGDVTRICMCSYWSMSTL